MLAVIAVAVVVAVLVAVMVPPPVSTSWVLPEEGERPVPLNDNNSLYFKT